ncbi:MAG TPA: hypothetical protein VEY67_07495 [Candidatus Dormibacteraeota bacterium]|nr:hypothetical protein [Candidatus Dormibacteraeota bacterium]
MRLKSAVFAAAAGAAGVYAYRTLLRPWWRAWGVDPREADLPLPGDSLVPEPDHIETRGIDIAAPPEAVWPWLVQMGYGRAGWYSYDRIDMQGGSAWTIRPELQRLEAGELVPTHPGGGFVVRELEPDRALVLYIDDAIVEAQAKAARAAAADGTAEATPAGLRASGAFLSATSTPRFVASWAFVLEPRGRGSRLVERFRVVMQGGGSASKLGGPFLGFGVFLMMRKQLLGIRERAERTPAGGAAPAAEATTGVDEGSSAGVEARAEGSSPA